MEIRQLQNYTTRFGLAEKQKQDKPWYMKESSMMAMNSVLGGTIMGVMHTYNHKEVNSDLFNIFRKDNLIKLAKSSAKNSLIMAAIMTFTMALTTSLQKHLSKNSGETTMPEM